MPGAGSGKDDRPGKLHPPEGKSDPTILPTAMYYRHINT